MYFYREVMAASAEIMQNMFRNSLRNNFLGVITNESRQEESCIYCPQHIYKTVLHGLVMKA